MSVTPFSARETAVPGLWVMQMKEVADARGVVREVYRESAFRQAGLPSLGPWLQINLTESNRGVIRGLHGESMFKLVSVASGSAYGAYLDARPDSPRYGAVETVELAPGTAVLVPRGVCNGFQATGPDTTQYLYSFDAEWVPGMAGTAVNPLDASLGIPWPVPIDPANEAFLSAKDAGLPSLESAGGPA